jgi:hypothetical protein
MASVCTFGVMSQQLNAVRIDNTEMYNLLLTISNYDQIDYDQQI